MSPTAKKGKRQPDVSQSDDRNLGLTLLNLAFQLRKMGGRNRLAAHNLRGIAHDSSMADSPFRSSGNLEVRRFVRPRA